MKKCRVYIYLICSRKYLELGWTGGHPELVPGFDSHIRCFCCPPCPGHLGQHFLVHILDIGMDFEFEVDDLKFRCP